MSTTTTQLKHIGTLFVRGCVTLLWLIASLSWFGVATTQGNYVMLTAITFTVLAILATLLVGGIQKWRR